MALLVDDWDALVARLERAGIAYTRSRSGRAAIFCRDLDGMLIAGYLCYLLYRAIQQLMPHQGRAQG